MNPGVSRVCERFVYLVTVELGFGVEPKKYKFFSMKHLEQLKKYVIISLIIKPVSETGFKRG